MLPAMCGSDTLTTVVSRISMTVAHMTAMATIHGFISGWDVTDSAGIPGSYYPCRTANSAIIDTSIPASRDTMESMKDQLTRRGVLGAAIVPLSSLAAP